MNYEKEVEATLNTFAQVRKSSRNKDARFHRFLELLGYPEKKYPTMHVAGTSGKGSTATFISSILQDSGAHVGLTLSPHVVTVRERIQIDNQPIDVGLLYRYLQEIVPVAIQVSREVSPLSYFEVLTGLAFYIFAQEKVDVAVVEAGIGGTRDVTNVIRPEVAVLTNVDLDHTRVLGNTKEKIAQDKAGIIKPHTPLITGAQQSSVLEIIRATASKNSAAIYELGNHISYHAHTATSEGSYFDLTTPWGSFKKLEIHLPGLFQIENASLAAAAVLVTPSFSVHEEAIRTGLRDAYIPGRFELIQRDPPIILDGAHNPVKIHFLLASIQEIFPGKTIKLLFLPKKDKDSREMLEEMFRYTPQLYVTSLKDTPIPRLLAETAQYIQSRTGHEVKTFSDPEEAFKHLRSNSEKEDIGIVTGSFYLVGEIKRFLEKERHAW